MSSVAFFCMPEPGHFQRMRSLVAGLSGLGMKAHFFTHRDFRGYVERAGGTFVDLFERYPPPDVTSLPMPCRHVTFAARYAEDLARDLRALGTSLVVYDTFAVVGFVVARLLDVPYVNVCAGHNVEPSRFLAALGKDPRVKVSPECQRAVETLRARYGIADASPFSYVTALSPHLNVYCEPPQFLDESERRPFEPIAFYGSLPSIEEPFDPVEKAAAMADPFGDAKLKVYVSFGTIVWRYFAAAALAALGVIADALAARPDARVLVSLGGTEIGAETMDRITRPNLTVARYVDQRRVLGETDAYLTHQGLNSTHEAIFHEVPMISYPFFWDQPALARRCQRLGLAVPLTDMPRGPLQRMDIDGALSSVLANREPMRKALERARGWEIEVMANRSSVLRRIARLAGA